MTTINNKAGLYLVPAAAERPLLRSVGNDATSYQGNRDSLVITIPVRQVDYR